LLIPNTRAAAPCRESIEKNPIDPFSVLALGRVRSTVLVKEEELNGGKAPVVEEEETVKLLFNEKNIENNVAIYAVVDNKNIAELFLKDGAVATLIGGQTKNPSVADIEDGLKKISAKTIYILPNNKNIIASAKLAARRDKRDIIVIDTKTMLEGYYFTKNRKMNLQSLLSS